jgi:hypothetical protein
MTHTLNTRMTLAVIRWFRAQSAPRHVQIEAEAALAQIAVELLHGEGQDNV